MTFNPFDHIPRDSPFVTLLNPCDLFCSYEAESEFSSAKPKGPILQRLQLLYICAVYVCLLITLAMVMSKRSADLIPLEALQSVSEASQKLLSAQIHF